jgi:ATP/maltotriose-dependent transcriptional regulator MalT
VHSLRQGSERRLVVVTAEAGYGKTCLLVSALAHLDRPIAWLALDETDTDPNLFGAGIILALRRVAPGIGQDALDVLTAGPSQESLVTAIVHALGELAAETILVVDDFHVLDDSPAALALIDRVLAHAALHLVVASRTRPALRGLPRLLVEHEALVLDREALAFRPDEARALLAESFALPVDDDCARDLATRTEGWAAALSLVAQAAERHGLPALAGTPREIFDYLATTVLDGLPTRMQEFALRTSVLFELTPALCAEVAALDDASGCLESLEERNLFLYRLDAGGTRYRYHQLFAEFLRARLAGRQPGLVAELHRRAGRHLEAEGHGDQAVRHYLLAGAYPEAVRTLLPYRAARLTAQRAYLFRDLVRRLPRAVADAQPWLLRTAASSCRFIGDYEQALTWSRQAMEAADGRDSDLWAHAAHGVVVMLRSMGRLTEALATAEDALQRMPADANPGLGGDLYQALAYAHLLHGDLAESARANETSLRLAAPPYDLDGRGQALLTRGRLALVRLEPTAASHAFGAVLDYAGQHESASYQSAAWAGLASAHVALGDVAAAADALGRAQALHARVGERALELQLAWTEADLARLRGDVDSAERHYERALALCREGEIAGPRVLALLGLARVRLSTSEAVPALERAREAALIAARGELGGLLPLARLTEAEACASIGSTKEGLAALGQASASFTAWGSGPGQARCALLEVHLRARRSPARLVAQAVALAVRHHADLVGWLRESASWTAPLLARLLGREGVDVLLVGLGDRAAPALVDALDDPRRRLAAIDALARLGDARARRPLQRWSRHGAAVVRLAASVALSAIGQPCPPALEVRLFGRFEISRDGRLVEDAEWTTRKVRSLVKLLLLNRPGGLHDEQLVEWLWPDHDAARGASSLKTAVKLARRALEPWLEGGASHFIERASQVLSFTDAGVWIDLDEHARLVAEARGALAAGRIDEAITRLERAVALYRGDLLDPEDRYETWAEAPRAHWRQSHLEALVELSHLRASLGDYERAATVMRGVVALDPLRETAYRDLMRYALLRGRRDEALATYRECSRALEHGLGVAPEPATRQLLDEVHHPA